LTTKKRSYVDFDQTIGYPGSKSLYFECGLCGDYIPSQPKESVSCKCMNILIDVDAGRVSVKKEKLIKVFKFV